MAMKALVATTLALVLLLLASQLVLFGEDVDELEEVPGVTYSNEDSMSLLVEDVVAVAGLRYWPADEEMRKPPGRYDTPVKQQDAEASASAELDTYTVSAEEEQEQKDRDKDRVEESVEIAERKSAVGNLRDMTEETDQAMEEARGAYYVLEEGAALAASATPQPSPTSTPTPTPSRSASPTPTGIVTPNLADLMATFRRERLPYTLEQQPWQDGLLDGMKVAYAFYVTDRQYACGAQVVVEQLKALGSKAGFMVAYMAGSLGEDQLEQMREAGIVTRQVADVPGPTSRYYKHALVKFRVFQQYDYDRLIFMDSDVSAVRNMDELFSLRMGNLSVAAAPHMVDPKSYESGAIMPWLMLIRPTEELWKTISTEYLTAAGIAKVAAAQGTDDVYDGEIINYLFGQENSVKIPPHYAVNNCEWYLGTPNKFFHLMHNVTDAPAGAVHYSCWQKPWYHTEANVEQNARLFEPSLAAMYHEWFRVERQLNCL